MILQENYDTHYQYDIDYKIGEESIRPEIMEHIGQNADLYCEERSADHQPTELDHDDADRRTLDESQADEDEDDQD
jgi:hypothetical protein